MIKKLADGGKPSKRIPHKGDTELSRKVLKVALNFFLHECFVICCKYTHIYYLYIFHQIGPTWSYSCHVGMSVCVCVCATFGAVFPRPFIGL